MNLKDELNYWKTELNNCENELNELNKPIDVTTISAWDIDKRTERKMHLEQLIQENKEIIEDIKMEMEL